MGIFSIFKRSKKRMTTELPTIDEMPYDITFTRCEDGKLMVDFHDKQCNEWKLYDTTRLIIDEHEMNLSGYAVKQCSVSWYRDNDMVVIGNQCQDDYKNVLTLIDTELLQKDEAYCVAVMRELLEKTRVEHCLENGISDSPERCCGKYIGEVIFDKGRYKKNFINTLGIEAHYLPEMVKERLEAIKQNRERGLKQEKINLLYAQINDLNGRANGSNR